MNLPHVLWLGGSPCSGKSSMARLLAGQHNLQIYHVDDAFGAHVRRIAPDRHPTLHKWTTTPWNDLWTQSLDTLLAEAIAAYREHFELILEDLRALPRSVPVLAEGTALLPDCVAGLLTDRRRAVWVVPTEAFQREHYPRRGDWVQGIVSQCADPERALQNWMDRDVAFARWVAERARALGLPQLEVDGTRSIAENAGWVAHRLRF